MLECRVVTHRTYSFYGKGPYVRNMFDILSELGCPYEIDVTKVRVVGAFISHDNPKLRLFRNEYNLSQQSRKKHPNYIPYTQSEIEQMVEESEKIDRISKEKGIETNVIEAVEFLDQEDKGGSYVEFADREGLIEGRIKYFQRSLSTGKREIGSFIDYIGFFVSVYAISLGYVMKQDIAFAAGVGLLILNSFSMFGGKGFTRYLETRIKTKDDSEKAEKKARRLIDLIEKKF